MRPAALALSFLPLQACANIAEHGVIGVVRSACWLRHLKTIKQDTLTHLCMLLCSLRNVFRREFITDFSRVEGVQVRGARGRLMRGGGNGRSSRFAAAWRGCR